MSKKNTQQKTRQKTLFFVVMFVGFLGTGIFAGINVFAAYQKNQDFSQVDAEEKFYRLPEYLLVDRALLEDKDFNVRRSTAKALGELRSKEAISELISLHKTKREYICSMAGALAKLGAIPQLMSSSRQNNSQNVSDCVGIALYKLQLKETIPQLIELLKDSNYAIKHFAISLESDLKTDATKALNKLQEKGELEKAELLLAELLKNSDDPALSLIGAVITRLHSTQKKSDFTDSSEYSYKDNILDCIPLMDMDTDVDIISNRAELTEEVFTVTGFITDSDSFACSYSKKKAIPNLIELLQHSDSSTRLSAAHLLGKLQAKEAIPQLTTTFNDSTGIEEYKMLQVLITLDGLKESDSKKWMLEMIKELERFDAFSDSEKKSLIIDIATQLYLKFNQYHKVNPFSMNQSRRIRDTQWMLAESALTAFSFLLMLTLFSLRELQRILWKDYLICYLPEEAVGEMIAFRRKLTQAKKSKLLIETKLLYEIFTLIWAFYIQINIENLWLPSKDQRRR